MTSSASESIPCPNCGKSYRWKPELVGRKVACKTCGTEFSFPDQPGDEKPAADAEDNAIYELARDPDEERELPPAYEVPSDPDPPTDAPPSQPPAEPTVAAGANTDTTEPEDASDSGEPELHISEAKKAARREAQRKAAAEQEAIRTWRDYKLLYVVLALLLLFVILYWAIYAFSDAMEEGLHNTMRPDRPHVVALDRGEPT